MEMENEKKKINIYLFLLCVSFFIFIFYRKAYRDYKMNETNTYSIATVNRVSLGDGDMCYYNIEYQNKILKGETSIPSWRPYNIKIKIGERYLVKISKDDLSISELQFKHLVPECVRDAPNEGWEGIPDFSKICD